MVYKLNKRGRFFRLRHYRYRGQLMAGVIGVMVAGIISMRYVSIPQALGMYKPSVTGPRPVGSAHAGLTTANGTDKPSRLPPGVTAATTTPLRITTCSDLPSAPAGLASSQVPELRKLAQYAQVCNGFPVSRSSFFVPSPANTAQANTYAADVAFTLKQYAQYGITPLVFMEPNTADGQLIDLQREQTGAYDNALDTYFSSIKAAGITDVMMGTWVMFPEANLPEWTSVDPNVFAANVTKVVSFQKKYFPASLASIMLDSETYPSASSWDNGNYQSLLPYVQGIPKGVLNSFGLQGFPWASPANQPASDLYDPTVYLRTDFAAAAARSLGVNDIWLNTGTFARMYANKPAETVALSPADRQAMLDGVVTQAKSLQRQGFSVSVHLFAQDKSGSSEGTDWSYWKTPHDGQNTMVFTAFVHDLEAANIPLWLFDTY